LFPIPFSSLLEWFLERHETRGRMKGLSVEVAVNDSVSSYRAAFAKLQIGLSAQQLGWNRKFVVPVAAVAFLAGLANCRSLFGSGAESCSASVEPAVVVEIRDARTQLPLAASARGVVRDGTYVDSLRPHSGGGTPFILISRFAAFERRGTYSVKVEAPRYRTWTLGGVVVIADQCHVRTRHLRAES
jgi:hypothetical protein